MDAIKHDCFTTHLSTKQRCQVNTIRIRAAGQKRDLRRKSSWAQSHITVSKAGLQGRGGSLRELVKSGLVTLLTREREGQVGEFNKTLRFSLSWTLFLLLPPTTPFLCCPYAILPSTFNLLLYPSVFLSTLSPRSLSQSLRLCSDVTSDHYSLPSQRLHVQVLLIKAMDSTEWD